MTTKQKRLLYSDNDTVWGEALEAARRAVHASLSYVDFIALQDHLVKEGLVDVNGDGWGGRNSVVLRIARTTYGFDLKRMLQAVQAVIESYSEVSGICTLHNLERLICVQVSQRLKVDPPHSCYEKLMLGPLCAHPFVKTYFNPPKLMLDSQIPKITAGMVLEKFQEVCVATKGKFDREDIANDLVRKLLVKFEGETISDLGIRLHKLEHTIFAYHGTLQKLTREGTSQQKQFDKQLQRQLDSERAKAQTSSQVEMTNTINSLIREVQAAMTAATAEMYAALQPQGSGGAGLIQCSNSSKPSLQGAAAGTSPSPQDAAKILGSARQLSVNIKDMMQLVTGAGSKGLASISLPPPPSAKPKDARPGRPGQPAKNLKTPKKSRKGMNAKMHEGEGYESDARSDVTVDYENEGQSAPSPAQMDPCDPVAWKHVISDIAAQQVFVSNAPTTLACLSKISLVLEQLCTLMESGAGGGIGGAHSRGKGGDGKQTLSGYMDRRRGRWHVSKQKVKEIVLDVAASGKALDLSDLAALECQLMDSFQVDSFADLGSWPSLLSALSDDVNSDLAEPLRLALGTGCEPGHKAALAGAAASAPAASLGHKVLRERAAVLLSMAGAAGGAADVCGGSEQELADRLCAQFCVERVEDLGLGPLADLVKQSAGAGSCAPAIDAVLPVFGMCEPLGAAEAGSQLSCKLLGMSDDSAEREGSEWDELAMRRLRDAQPLSELHESLLWAEVFEPRLGSLRKWVYQNPGQILGVYILDSPCGLYVVPPLGSMSEFAAALHGCDAPKAACQLVSALMECSMVGDGSSSSCSSRLISVYCRVKDVVLKQVEAVRGDLEGERAMALFLAQLLQRVPSWGLRASCLRPLLLDPLESGLGSHRSFELLRHASIHDSGTSALLYTLAARLASSELEFAKRWLKAWLQVEPSTAIASRQTVPPVLAVIKGPELAPSPVPEDGAELCTAITDVETTDVQTGGDDLAAGSDELAEDIDELAEDEVSWQQTFVEDEIRRKIYGKGLQLTAEGQGVDDEKNRMLAASMSHLARDIYDDSLHFLLELVQNAEDNEYPVGKAASLEFIRQAGCMFAVSNESGFSCNNIRSLCRIGMSSKSSAPGYIGQKGIGFKSVFKVSDAPEVHSNGFHIAFDLQREPDLGYACPVWVGPPADESDWSSMCIQSPEDVRTVIRIPLKQEYVYNADRLTNDLFGSVSPHLLLFLEKLCRISCVDAVSSRTSVSEKLLTPDCPSVVTLRQTEDGTARSSSWLVVRSKFKPTVCRNTAGKQIVVAETQVSLAFDMESRKEPGRMMEAQLVYAYLPLKSYGLKFIVNADFIVTGSRKDVHKDEQWNVELREHICTAFIAARHALPQDPEEGPYLSLNFWLKCIPLQSVHLEFFSSLPWTLTQAVLQEGCFIRSGSGKAVSPREHKVRVCSDPNLSALLQDQDLQACLARKEFHFVHASLDALTTHQDAAILRAMLHVPLLHVDDLVTLLRSLCTDAALQHPGDAADAGGAAPAADAGVDAAVNGAGAGADVDGAADGGAIDGATAVDGAVDGGKGGKGVPGVGAATNPELSPHPARDASAHRQHLMLLVGNLLVAIYRMLEHNQEHNLAEVMGKLSSIPFLPLSSGRFVSPASVTRAMRSGEVQVYLPLPGHATAAQATAQPHHAAAVAGSAAVAADAQAAERPWESELSQRLANDLLACSLSPSQLTGIEFVDLAFLELADVESTGKRQLLTNCLKDLNIEELSAEDILHIYVYPTFESAQHALDCTEPEEEGERLGGGRITTTTTTTTHAMGSSTRGISSTHSTSTNTSTQLAQCMAFMLTSGILAPSTGGPHRKNATERLLDILRESAVLVCQQGRLAKCPSASMGSAAAPHHEARQAVYLPQQLNILKADLTSSFPTFDWLVVDFSVYSRFGGVDRETWAWLFHELGCTPFLRVLPLTHYHALPEGAAAPVGLTPHMLGSPRGGLSRRPAERQVAKVDDWVCLEFSALVKSIKEMNVRAEARKQLGLLAHLLHTEWADYYGSKVKVQRSTVAASSLPAGSWERGVEEAGDVDGPHGSSSPGADSMVWSEFGLALRNMEWLPATCCAAAYADVLQPSILFSKVMFPTLGQGAPYVDSALTGIHDDSPMARALGVMQDLCLEPVLGLLYKWSSSGGSSGSFKACLRQMRNLYSYLSHECRKSPGSSGVLVSKAFGDELTPLVWLPRKVGLSQAPLKEVSARGPVTRVEAGEDVEGHFYWWASLCSIDHSSIMELVPDMAAPRRVLANYYTEELHFFQGLLQLQGGLPLLECEVPSMEEYMAALQHLCRSCGRGWGVPSADVLPKVSKVFALWEAQVQEGTLQIDTLAALLNTLAVIPMEGGGWASLQDMPYLDDDAQLAQKFRGVAGVLLVLKEFSKNPLLLRLADATPGRGLQSLSCSVKREKCFYMMHQSPVTNSMARSVLKHVQRFLLTRDPEHHHTCADQSKSRLLSFMLFPVTKDTLTVSYSVKTLKGEVCSAEEHCDALLMLDEGRVGSVVLYVCAFDAFKRISDELSRLFYTRVNPPLSLFLCELMMHFSMALRERLAVDPELGAAAAAADAKVAEHVEREGFLPLPEEEDAIWTVPQPKAHFDLDRAAADIVIRGGEAGKAEEEAGEGAEDTERADAIRAFQERAAMMEDPSLERTKQMKQLREAAAAAATAETVVAGEQEREKLWEVAGQHSLAPLHTGIANTNASAATTTNEVVPLPFISYETGNTGAPSTSSGAATLSGTDPDSMDPCRVPHAGSATATTGAGAAAVGLGDPSQPPSSSTQADTGTVPHAGNKAGGGSTRELGEGSGSTLSDVGGAVQVLVPELARVPMVPTGDYGEDGQGSTGWLTAGSGGGQANSGHVSHFSLGDNTGSNGGQANSGYVSKLDPGYIPGSNGGGGVGGGGGGAGGGGGGGGVGGGGAGAAGFRAHNSLGLHVHEAGNTSWAVNGERLGLNSNNAGGGANLAEQLDDLPAVVVDVVQQAWGRPEWAADGVDASVGGNNVAEETLTGKWGELFVYHYLCNEHSWAAKEGFSVEWVNQEEESEKPYDLVLRRNEEVLYIEVKATRSSSLDAFNFSVRQAEMMVNEAGRYHIYRVYAARSDKPRITILKDPATMWDQQQAIVSMAPAKHRS